MNLTYWPPHRMRTDLCHKGLDFIRRRFREEWGVTRRDVTFSSIHARDNFVLTDGNDIKGWLGLEADHECTNACIERGYPGSRLLQELIQLALRSFPKRRLFALVPINRTGSARAFLSAGFQLDSAPYRKIIFYPEKAMNLVYLEREHRSVHIPCISRVESAISKIRRLKNEPIRQNYGYSQ